MNFFQQCPLSVQCPFPCLKLWWTDGTELILWNIHQNNIFCGNDTVSRAFCHNIIMLISWLRIRSSYLCFHSPPPAIVCATQYLLPVWLSCRYWAKTENNFRATNYIRPDSGSFWWWNESHTYLVVRIHAGSANEIRINISSVFNFHGDALHEQLNMENIE